MDCINQYQRQAKWWNTRGLPGLGVPVDGGRRLHQRVIFSRGKLPGFTESALAAPQLTHHPVRQSIRAGPFCLCWIWFIKIDGLIFKN